MNFYPFILLWFISATLDLSLGTQGSTQRSILKRLLADKTYDVNDHPHANDRAPTVVSVQLYINSFGSLNAADMEYSLDTFLRQRWEDPRLRFSDPEKDHLVVQDEKMRAKIWKPDTFFVNVKFGQIHMTTMPNVLFRINDDGSVLYSMRLRMRLSCYMDFNNFPLDSQVCAANLSSYSRTEDAIAYQWNISAPLDIPETLEIAQFDLLANTTYNYPFVYGTGRFSGLQVKFSLRRQNGYHLLQTYIPTVIIVCISWVSFWIDPNHVPGRVTLGVTTLLTLTTLASGIRSQLPPVSYVKAIDVWIGMCMIMVFGGLLEFTVANWLANRKIPPGKTPCKIPGILMICSVSAEEGDKESDAPVTPKPPTTYINHARAVDRASRILFPGSFLVFNIAYWPYYLVRQYMALM